MTLYNTILQNNNHSMGTATSYVSGPKIIISKWDFLINSTEKLLFAVKIDEDITSFH